MTKRKKSRKKSELPGDKYLREAEKFARRDRRRKIEAAKAETVESQPVPAYWSPRRVARTIPSVTTQPTQAPPLIQMTPTTIHPKPSGEPNPPDPLAELPPMVRKPVRGAENNQENQRIITTHRYDRPTDKLPRTVSPPDPRQPDEPVLPGRTPTRVTPLDRSSYGHTDEERSHPASPICPLLGEPCLGPLCMWFVHVGCVFPEINRQISQDLIPQSRSLYLMLEHLLKELNS